MQIILLEKVANVGVLGDIVKVKDGYARNFLIPQGKAKRATESNKKEFAERRVELEAKAAQTLTGAQSRAAKLEGYMLQIGAKAGVDGRLFGSVTSGDIAAGLKAQGFPVEKTEIRLPNGPLKAIGDFAIKLHLHTDVDVNLTVSVRPEV